MTEYPTWEELCEAQPGTVYDYAVGDGIAWLVRKGHVALCAYVGFPPDSPFFGLPYEAADAIVDVHGGFTFSGQWIGTPEEIANLNQVDLEKARYILEQIPKEIRDWWWFGWDYGHAWDEMPWSQSIRDVLGSRLPAPEPPLPPLKRWMVPDVVPQAEDAARGFSAALREFQPPKPAGYISSGGIDHPVVGN